MPNRFDLETEIIKFSGITEDLRRANTKLNDAELDIIIKYYDNQYEYLWSMFETLISEGKIT